MLTVIVSMKESLNFNGVRIKRLPACSRQASSPDSHRDHRNDVAFFLFGQLLEIIQCKTHPYKKLL